MIGDVIEVAVGEPEADDVEAVLDGVVEQGADSVVRRVKNDRLLRLGVADEIRVGGGDAARCSWR
jgi:hypothetical protein